MSDEESSSSYSSDEDWEGRWYQSREIAPKDPASLIKTQSAAPSSSSSKFRSTGSALGLELFQPPKDLSQFANKPLQVPGAPLLKPRDKDEHRHSGRPVKSVIAHTSKSGDKEYYSVSALKMGELNFESGIQQKYQHAESLFEESMTDPSARDPSRYAKLVQRRVTDHMRDDATRPAAEFNPESHLFDSKIKINLAVDEYLRRVAKATKINPVCLLVAAMYIERLCSKVNVCITQDNVHGIVLGCTMLASKHFEDIPYANSYWSALSGTFPKAQINEMELFILKALNFQLNISELSFRQYAKVNAL
eukprot:comp20315_c0_seq1/m.40525 comp20315_c0_seq1/g.40525  ORF comp20315_c0_seq1/g.40525 comp20315_c0_seq1/m.40525 type:complete len:306 (-) comp20315_c0_seq1:26-943(-)